jgi:hypothetical protein
MLITMHMRSTHDWNTTEKAQELASILISQGGFVLPERFDDHEPARHVFDSQDLSEFVKLWTADIGWVFLKRKKPYPFSMMVHWWYREDHQFNELWCHTDDRYLRKDHGISKLLDAARHLYLWGNVAHGYICHPDEWNTKNYFGVPTRVTGGNVVSTGGLRLEASLPGIYWVNFFGPVYVNFIGRDRFLTVPAYHREELPDGGFLLLTSPHPSSYTDPDVQSLEQSILNHLGRAAFFEKERPLKVCRAPMFRYEQAALSEYTRSQSYDHVTELVPDPDCFLREVDYLAKNLSTRLKGTLDYSRASLTLVDDYVLKKSYRDRQPWHTVGGRRIIQELAAYYGAVLCRTFKGSWQLIRTNNQVVHPCVVFSAHGCTHVESPVARVSKLWLERERSDGLANHYDLLQSGEWYRFEDRLKEI